MQVRKRRLLFTAGIFALLVAGCCAIVFQARCRRDMLNAEIARKQAALVRFDRSMRESRDLAAKVATLNNAAAQFESRLPRAAETDKVIEEIWHLAAANSLQTRTIKVASARPIAHYKEQEMDLGLAGDFGGFYQFLLQLENTNRVVRIRKMSLTRIKERDGDVQVDLTLGVLLAPQAGT